jgi:hypothetical protein
LEEILIGLLVSCASPDHFSALPVTQARIKGILILFITYVWFSLNHIQDPFGVLDENFRIYTLVTPIKF